MRYPAPPRRLPRHVRLGFLGERRLAVVIGLFCGVLPPLLVLPLLIKTVVEKAAVSPDYERILAEGTLTEGVITKKEETGPYSDGMHTARVTYTYVVDGETRKDVIESMDVRARSQWQVGDVVAVRHLDGDSILPGAPPGPRMWWLFVLIPGFWMAIGLPPLFWAVARARWRNRLYRLGELRRATVLALHTVPTNFSRGFTRVRYRFADDRGAEREAEDDCTDRSLGFEKRVGDEVDILVLPGDEGASCVVDESVMLKAKSAVDADTDAEAERGPRTDPDSSERTP